MAYIGRDTDKISNVEVLDNITFDGSSSYTLQKGGSNFTPSSANTLLVSINGVVQAGNFTVSGSTINFGVAIAGTSTCDFILHYGIGLITVPADGSVTSAKLASGVGGVAGITSSADATAITIDSSENVGIGGTPSSTQRLIVNGDGSSIIGGIQFRNASGGGSTASIGMANATSSSLLIDVNSASNMVFKNSGGTERMRIKSDGTVRIGTSSVVGSIEVTDGIYIGGTGTANKLDDYEEGTWTPAFSFSGGSVSYGSQLGVYTKIGRYVFAHFSFSISSVSSPSGTLTITGLPFSAGSGEQFVSGVTFSIIRSLHTNYNNLRGYVSNNGNVINLPKNDTNVGHSSLDASQLRASSLMYGSLHYQTD
jgi:hypothetical protein